MIGEVKHILAIKTAGTLRDPWVKTLKMVGGADHEDAMVGLEAVDGVEEVGAEPWGDERVDVFKDEDAGCHLAGLLEDHVNAEFGAHEATKGLDVEEFHGGVFALGKAVHEGLDRDSLPVAWRAIEDETSLFLC